MFHSDPVSHNPKKRRAPSEEEPTAIAAVMPRRGPPRRVTSKSKPIYESSESEFSCGDESDSDLEMEIPVRSSLRRSKRVATVTASSTSSASANLLAQRQSINAENDKAKKLKIRGKKLKLEADRIKLVGLFSFHYVVLSLPFVFSCTLL
jgi:hypothetical protein